MRILSILANKIKFNLYFIQALLTLNYINFAINKNTFIKDLKIGLKFANYIFKTSENVN